MKNKFKVAKQTVPRLNFYEKKRCLDLMNIRNDSMNFLFKKTTYAPGI